MHTNFAENLSTPSIDQPGSESARAVTAGQPSRRPLRGMPRVSCVVPCFNEADNLRRLLPELVAFLQRLFGLAWEVVLVDDGSDDTSIDVMEHWTRRANIRALQLSRNFGKEAALAAGIELASGDVVVLLDADLQHPIALIEEMVERWRKGADVVYALRRSRSEEHWTKRVGTRLFYRLINLGDRFAVPPDAGDFRLMDRNVVDALLALPERNRFMKGLYAWVGFRAEAIPYVPDERAEGRSKFGLLRLVRLSVDGLTGFTTWPLRLASIAGVVLAMMAIVYGSFLVVSYLLYGNPASGWTTIVVLLLLFAGIQMVSLGILGEYVARIFQEVKGRPLYVVRRRLGQGSQPWNR
jgi:polyisoprenyl-phosphate glycosyltransferase